jgi:hypothetical protein
MQFRGHTLPEAEIYDILANRRRRATLEYLSVERATGLHELSAAVATHESGQSPAPRALRESVYSSLHQTHLPKLDDLGVVAYDREARSVTLCDRARDVDRYLRVSTRFGVTWSEFYRTFGVLALTVVVCALVGVPWLSAVDPLLWASGGLAVFALTIAYQLWQSPWSIRASLRD